MTRTHIPYGIATWKESSDQHQTVHLRMETLLSYATDVQTCMLWKFALTTLTGIDGNWKTARGLSNIKVTGDLRENYFSGEMN